MVGARASARVGGVRLVEPRSRNRKAPLLAHASARVGGGLLRVVQAGSLPRHVSELLQENGEYVDARALTPARTWVRYGAPDAAPVTDGPHPRPAT